jgi:hypothetical protein
LHIVRNVQTSIHSPILFIFIINKKITNKIR